MTISIIGLSVVFNSNCFADKEVKMDSKIQEANMIKGLVIVHMQKGDAFFEKKNYPEALKRYMMAINNAPQDPRPYYKAAQCLKKLNQPEQAEEMIQEAKKIENNQTN
jgi:tetratricopeptide (TPR) repeat protein